MTLTHSWVRLDGKLLLFVGHDGGGGGDSSNGDGDGRELVQAKQEAYISSTCAQPAAQ